MQSDHTLPEESRTEVRDFAPAHSGGGLIAAAGLLLISVLAAASALPGTIFHAAYPTWLRWLFLLAPIPLAALLVAVVREAEFKIRIDESAVRRRPVLGATLRVPWREVTDYFADCGRSPAEMAEAGGSMVHIAAVAGDAVPLLPFAQHEPDYTIVSTRGPMVLDDCLADLAELTQAVTANAPAGAPTRWEEATWVTCEHCEQRVAVSVRPDPAATPADDSTEGQPGPAVGCAACGEAIEKLSTGIGHGFTVQLRGQALADPEPNGGRQPDGE